MFDYIAIADTLMTAKMVSRITTLHEYRGKQERYMATKPDYLDRLRETAIIQSTGASNRIENIAVPDARLRQLMKEDTAPRDRNESEVAGYRYVLDLIHTAYPDIPFTPNVILQLHRDLNRYTNVAYAGAWKDSDNEIQERNPDGTTSVRFRPLSAARTPSAMSELCDGYRSFLENGAYDPLLAIPAVVFDFVSVHPFLDGNGRISRLLTLLLLYKQNYLVGKYISIEREIELSKQSYYDALQASSEGWCEGANDYQPFTLYILDVLIACYKTLDERLGMPMDGMTNKEIVLNFFDNLIGTATKREVADACPSMSAKTVERIIQQLMTEGRIEKIGASRATRYKKVL